MPSRAAITSLALAGSFAAGAAPAAAATHALGSRTLVLGDRGSDVRGLQRLLNQAGCHLQHDGDFGPATYHCVRWVQRGTGLRVTGVVSRTLVAAIRAGVTQLETGGASASTPPPASAPVDPRATGGAQAGTTTAAATAPQSANPTSPTDPTIPAAPPIAATLSPTGLASISTAAPAAVQAMVAAGNQIATTPYLYGGGHQSWTSPGGYDCSGSVSYVLHAAGLLDSPLVSGALASWGDAGVGRWVTIYANAQHTWMIIAGLRFDTGGLDDAVASRWQSALVPTAGYAVRHPAGL
ncbi:MAG TPA: peptidoglycan-binding protein [Solirubrobacteraceae bacterium]|jgi:peptidoglycan hydrolase-like protein with peptidoglycan-binding domain|nr:peptidoglycan-binding protein [Solirubrobacteraceae bacterium]